MFLLRTCPPLGVLARGGAQVDRHLAVCSVCRDTLRHAQTFADVGKLLADMPLPRRTPTPPTPGELRRVRPLGGPETWFDAEGRYHNPPLVLVLDAPDDYGFVRVAQIFHEQDLRDQGDIPLDAGQQGFAEAWNVYGLPKSGLADVAFRKVSPEHASRVLAAAAQNFPALDPSQALFHFRSSELETGAFFSLPLNAAALASQEAAEQEDALPGRILAHGAHVLRTVLRQAAPSRHSPVDFGMAALMAHAPEKRAGTSSVLDQLRSKLQDYVRAWSGQIAPLAAAAASREDFAPDSEADKTLRLPCLIVTATGERQPWTVSAKVDVHFLDQGFFCQAWCRIPGLSSGQVLAAVTCGAAQAQEEYVERPEMDVVCLKARFSDKNLRPEQLQCTILLTDLPAEHTDGGF